MKCDSGPYACLYNNHDRVMVSLTPDIFPLVLQHLRHAYPCLTLSKDLHELVLRHICRKIVLPWHRDFDKSIQYLRNRPRMASYAGHIDCYLVNHLQNSAGSEDAAWLWQNVSPVSIKLFSDCSELAYVIVEHGNLTRVTSLTLRLQLLVPSDDDDECACYDASPHLGHWRTLLSGVAATLRFLEIRTSNDPYGFDNALDFQPKTVTFPHLRECVLSFGRITWFARLANTPALRILDIQGIPNLDDDRRSDDLLSVPCEVTDLHIHSNHKSAIFRRASDCLRDLEWAPSLTLLALWPEKKAADRITFTDVEALSILAQARGIKATVMGVVAYAKLKEMAHREVFPDHTVMETMWSEAAQ